MIDFEEHLGASKRLVIAFAGGPQNAYQWGGTLKRLGLSYVLIRDSTQHYNHHGIQGIGGRYDVIDYIRDLFGRSDTLTTIGVSSGAYPALLYGQLAQVDEVIAISALTSRQADGFNPADHHLIVDLANPDVELLHHFPNGPIPRVKAFISDGDGTRLDRQMIERIGVKDITVVPGYSHADLARGMRDKGLIQELLT